MMTTFRSLMLDVVFSSGGILAQGNTCSSFTVDAVTHNSLEQQRGFGPNPSPVRFVQRVWLDCRRHQRSYFGGE
jgi:hypothetical protein